MLAIDSSSLIAYLGGERGRDVDAVEYALRSEFALLPPVVLSEIISDPLLPRSVHEMLLALPLLELSTGFWNRAGKLRAKIVAKKQRAKLADTLIAQSCIDHNVPLVTRDRDFQHFVSLGGLKLFRLP